MCGSKALRIALDLRNVPSLVRHIRTEPLPEGLLLLLQIAAGDPEAEQKALAMVDRSLVEIREASRFFIEQILFAPQSDSYRVLGAAPDAPATDLRRNMVLLLRWLHPDVDENGERHVFAGRVTCAWEDLKTSERRAAYDSRIMAEATELSGSSKVRSRKRLRGKPRMGIPELAASDAVRRRMRLRRRKPAGFIGRVLFLLSRRRWI